MIRPSDLPSWESIIERTGNQHLRRSRGRCPFCESRTGFSVHDEKGFHCFACGIHGNKISFIQQFHKCDFKDALRFFGLEPGKPPAPDPAMVRRQRVRAGLKAWAKKIGKNLRDEFLIRERVITWALPRLRNNAEDHRTWELLSWALTGHSSLEFKLDLLSGKEEQQIEIFKHLRAAA
jgi:hypothetical protein